MTQLKKQASFNVNQMLINSLKIDLYDIIDFYAHSPHAKSDST